jgi:tetratricopeptide (TPR) repeat protein
MLSSKRILISYLLVASILPVSSIVYAQGDIVPVSDLTGGSSVFVWPRGAGGAPKHFTSRAKITRTKEARVESTKRVTTQYETLAKVKPRRQRADVIDPTDPRLPKVGSMDPVEAAKLFTGVGEYYIDKNDSENSTNFFREAVSLDAKNTIAPKGLSEALSLKGNELLVKEKPDDAKKLFDEALKYNPNNAVAYYGLAEIYSEQQADDQSIASYEKALQYDKDLTEIYVPLGILYYQGGKIDKADELLSKAVVADPNSAETQYFTGLVRYSQNKNEASVAAEQKAIQLKPDYAEAYYALGQALERLDRSPEAAAAYQKALELKPNYFEAAINLGSEYYKQQQWDNSVAAYEKAVRLKNDNIQAYINLGDAYRQAKNYEKAESNYNLAVSFFERIPDFDKNDKADTYNKIGFVIAQQCPINTAKFLPCRWNVATVSLEKAASLTNDNVDYANLGWAYYNAAQRDMIDHKDVDAKAKLEKARTDLQRATAADSRYLTAPMVNLGMALNDLGDYPSAIDVLNKVVAREPKWTFAINELGVAYLLNKDYKNAIDRFNTVVKRDDKYTAAWFNLGKAHFANGNIGEAKKAYSQLRKLGANQLADRLDRETGGAMQRG